MGGGVCACRVWRLPHATPDCKLPTRRLAVALRLHVGPTQTTALWANRMPKSRNLGHRLLVTGGLTKGPRAVKRFVP